MENTHLPELEVSTSISLVEEPEVVPLHCENPTFLGTSPVPCGTCVLCRARLRKKWVARQLMEAQQHGNRISVVTLTYDDKHVPFEWTEDLERDIDEAEHYMVLKKTDAQLWQHRVRKHFNDTRLRFWTVGEYGDLRWRPHYHAIIYGLDPDRASRSMHHLWPAGLTDTDGGSEAAFAYCAGYVLKKLHKAPNLRGRPPEFSLMSRRPGIGMPFVDQHIIPTYRKPVGRAFIEEHGDIHRTVKFNGKHYPLDQLAKDRIYDALDFQPAKQRMKYYCDEETREHSRTKARQMRNRMKHRDL